MKELTLQQIADFEAELKQRQEASQQKVREFLNRPIKDKNGKEKPMSLHMRTEYIAQGLDDLHEMCRNSIQLHVANLHHNISDLWKNIEKLKQKINELENIHGR
jgi:hypothetical protein